MSLERIASSLRWFFQDAAGEMGLHSSFASMVNRIGGVHYEGVVSEMDSRAVSAALRARKIKRVLEAIGEADHAVLLLAFGAPEHQGHPKHFRLLASMSETLEAHGESKTSRALEDWLLRLCKAAKEGADIERKRLWVKLYLVAQRKADSALRAYASTEGLQRAAQVEADYLLD